mgnify:CR=1 FL=1
MLWKLARLAFSASTDLFRSVIPSAIPAIRRAGIENTAETKFRNPENFVYIIRKLPEPLFAVF